MQIIIKKIVLFIIVVLCETTISLSQNQLYDTFPLSVGNRWTYFYTDWHWSMVEYYSDVTDSGRVELKIVDKIEYQDYTIWKLSEYRKFRRYGVYQSGIKVDTILENSVEGLMQESKDGRHRLYMNQNTFVLKFGVNLRDSMRIYRYNNVDSLNIVNYHWEWTVFERYDFNFKPNQGLSKFRAWGGYNGSGVDLNAALVDNIILQIKSTEQKTIPQKAILFQNYPNPFNPKTRIEFNIIDPTFIRLKIFDLIGKEIETLIAGYYLPGSYSIDWDAKNISGGMYFYKIEAGNFIQTKKLILMK